MGHQQATVSNHIFRSFLWNMSKWSCNLPVHPVCVHFLRCATKFFVWSFDTLNSFVLSAIKIKRLLQEAGPSVDFNGSWNVSLLLPGRDVISWLMTERKRDIRPKIAQKKQTILKGVMCLEWQGQLVMTLSQPDSYCLKRKCFYDPSHDIQVLQWHKVKPMLTLEIMETMFFTKTRLEGF